MDRPRPIQPVDERPNWPAVLILMPIGTLVAGLFLAYSASNPKSLDSAMRLNLSHQWGGLAILSLAPVLFCVGQYRISGKHSDVWMIYFAIWMRSVLWGDGAERSWWSNVGTASTLVVVMLALVVPYAFFRRYQARRKVRAKLASPMWDADADLALATSGSGA